MSKKIIYIFLIATLIAFFASCTMEKRQHLPGYHVEYKGKSQKVEKRRNETAPQKNKEVFYADDNLNLAYEPDEKISSPVEIEIESAAVLQESTSASTANEKLIYPHGNEAVAGLSNDFISELATSIFKDNTASALAEPASAPKTVHGGAIASLLFAIAGFFILGIIFETMALIMSILALIDIKKNPDKYIGKVAAVLGLVISLIGLFILMAYFATL